MKYPIVLSLDDQLEPDAWKTFTMWLKAEHLGSSIQQMVFLTDKHVYITMIILSDHGLQENGIHTYYSCHDCFSNDMILEKTYMHKLEKPITDYPELCKMLESIPRQEWWD
jgi:hypothetical protein